MAILSAKMLHKVVIIVMQLVYSSITSRVGIEANLMFLFEGTVDLWSHIMPIDRYLHML